MIYGAKVVSQNNGADGEFSLIDTGFRRGWRYFAMKVLDLVCKLRMRVSFWFSVNISDGRTDGWWRVVDLHPKFCHHHCHLFGGIRFPSAFQWMHRNHACDFAFCGEGAPGTQRSHQILEEGHGDILADEASQ